MTNASCRIPAVASRRGDRPMFEMILAVAPSDFLTPKPPLIIRRPQKTKRYSHPKKPFRPCLNSRYKMGKARIT